MDTPGGLARAVHHSRFVQRSKPTHARAAAGRAALAALAAFVLTALIDEPTALDRALYARAGRGYNRRLERAQRPLEVFGLPGVHIPLAFTLAGRMRRRGRRGGSTIAMAAVAAWAAVRLSRVFLYRPRPPRPPGRGPKSESTFPSGHTTEMTALALVVAQVLADERMLTPRQASALRVGLPLLMGADRVYVREHWLTDVLGGWALGAAVGSSVLFVSSLGA
ncbi:MAG TPA: phosphatase PAP2 family protein [Gemmatimonadaceae bacterium]|nr:phosphatase PAP2 family protein [Gemmatimonadaceae bacterium]